MMQLPEKQQGKYVKCCVLVNGETDPDQHKDCRDQVYTRKEIKQLFTSEANQTNFDIYHNKNKIDGVTVVGNYINETSPETVGGVSVPSGSMFKILHVLNEAILEELNPDTGSIKGVSISLSADKKSNYCSCTEHLPIGEILYSDVQDKECFIVTWLSFVEKPCNQLPLEVMDYESYIDNMNGEDDNMKEEKSMFESIKEVFSEGIKLGKESAVNNADNNTSTEPNPVNAGTVSAEEIKNIVTEIVKPIKDDLEVLKTEVEDIKSEDLESSETGVDNSEDVVKEEDSIDDRRSEIRDVIVDKYFLGRDSDYDIWIDLMADDCVIIRDYSRNKYYKVDYSITVDGITLGELIEVELQYAVKDNNSSDTTETNTTGSEVNNSDLEEKITLIEEKLGIESNIDNSDTKPVPTIVNDLGKDVPDSGVNNEDKTPKDSYGRAATDYREL